MIFLAYHCIINVITISYLGYPMDLFFLIKLIHSIPKLFF